MDTLKHFSLGCKELDQLFLRVPSRYFWVTLLSLEPAKLGLGVSCGCILLTCNKLLFLQTIICGNLLGT